MAKVLCWRRAKCAHARVPVCSSVRMCFSIDALDIHVNIFFRYLYYFNLAEARYHGVTVTHIHHIHT